ncbi:transposase [Cytophagaceae bacterium ABcell3]|nr:transposase [Cytophagaceae bacterium ABcell3]
MKKLFIFTASVYKWKLLLKPDKYKQIIIDSLKYLSDNGQVKVYAFVIMPNHLHLLWKVAPLCKLEDVQRNFLKFTGQMIKFDLAKNHLNVLEHFRVDLKDRKYQFWQRNSLSKYLSSRKVIEQKLDYIHNNPVQGKWRLALGPLNYYFSSMRFYEEGKDDFGFLTHYMSFFE